MRYNSNINMVESRQTTHLALYRKYRPTDLKQVIGQRQVTDILSLAVNSKSFVHAYLFTGQRGTGKTTVARILAHLINGINYTNNIDSSDIDIIEIDAASNNSVEDIRELRNNINLAPMKSAYKIYIIDEFHMLSKSAFNALLKTIEEPPQHAIFILATTELQKVPPTILSRVQRFHFRPVEINTLKSHLSNIAKKENIEITDNALELIAKAGGGSVRDSITLLDQISNLNKKIDTADVEQILSFVPESTMDNIFSNIQLGDTKSIIKTIKELFDNGLSATAIAKQMVDYLDSRASAKPSYYYLIDQLLEVSKYALPDAKLLAILVIESLKNSSSREEEETKPTPAIDKKPSIKHVDKSSQKLIDSTSKEESKETATAKEPEEASETNKISGNASDNPQINFSWSDLIEEINNMDEPAAKSLVKLADYRFNQDKTELTLFFPKKFHRKKANANKFKDVLNLAYKNLYDKALNITVSDQSVPNDSVASKILDIMGGGEVIKHG